MCVSPILKALPIFSSNFDPSVKNFNIYLADPIEWLYIISRWFFFFALTKSHIKYGFLRSHRGWGELCSKSYLYFLNFPKFLKVNGLVFGDSWLYENLLSPVDLSHLRKQPFQLKYIKIKLWIYLFKP